MTGVPAPFRYHHVTLCVGGAVECHDFHTKVLGLKNVKRTLLYDGKTPIYHLYYGNDLGEPSTLVTTFPVRHLGKKARQGTGQFSSIDLSIPEASLDYWRGRLRELGYSYDEEERFGERRLKLVHPGGVEYQLVGVPEDGRAPRAASAVEAEHGIRGLYGTTVAVRDFENQAEFMVDGWQATEVARDGELVRYRLGEGGPGRTVDLRVQPNRAQGSWTFAEGSVHHCAFETDDFDTQAQIKGHLEGMGFTDVSDVKDRGYFDSVYVRSPSGALFEATVSKPRGLMEDEAADELGHHIILAPQFESMREAIVGQMEALPAPV